MQENPQKSTKSDEKITQKITESPIFSLDDSRLEKFAKKLNLLSFEKNRQVTRAEFSKITARFLGTDEKDIDKTILQNFSDISPENEFAPFFAFLIKEDIFHGQKDSYGNWILRPSEKISRAESAKIFAKILIKNAKNLQKSTEIMSYVDIDPNGDFVEFIKILDQNNILHGQINHKNERIFLPKANISLAEMLKILYNISLK